MKNGLCDFEVSCQYCDGAYRPRRDNPGSKFCSLPCARSSGLARQENPGYSGQHKRVYAEHGRASSYACSAPCGKMAQQWACVGDYANVDDYVPLCISHHKRFDLWRLGKRKAAL